MKKLFTKITFILFIIKEILLALFIGIMGGILFNINNLYLKIKNKFV